MTTNSIINGLYSAHTQLTENDTKYEFTSILLLAAAKLKALQRSVNSKWKSIDKKKPRVLEHVLIYAKDKEPIEAYLKMCNGNLQWFAANTYKPLLWSNQVTHWRSLPKTPEELE